MANSVAARLPVVKRTALVLEKVAGKYNVLELSLEDGRVVAEKLIKSEYYRDLAEHAAARRLRGMGR